MKTIKILALSILQTLLFTLSGYLLIRLSAYLLYDSAAAIGIIGGADGPTAIFVASKLNIGLFLEYSYISMFTLFLIANLSALVKNNVISVVLALVCFLFAVSGIYFALSNIAAWVWIVMIFIAVILMGGGYFISRKVINKG